MLYLLLMILPVGRATIATSDIIVMWSILYIGT